MPFTFDDEQKPAAAGGFVFDDDADAKPAGFIEGLKQFGTKFVENEIAGQAAREKRKRQEQYDRSNALNQTAVNMQLTGLNDAERAQQTQGQAAQKAYNDSIGTKAAAAVDLARDTALGVVKGGANTFVKLPLAVSGIAEDATGARESLESVGYRSKDALHAVSDFGNWLDSLKSDTGQARDKQYNATVGALDTLQEMGANPAMIMDKVAESLVGIGVVGKTAGAAVEQAMPHLIAKAQAAGLVGQAADDFIIHGATRVAQLAAPVAEGAQSGLDIAGTAQEAGRSIKEYGLPALTAAASTAAIGYGANKFGAKHGVGDIETDIALRGTGATGAKTGPGSAIERIVKEGAKEGLVEELPQSIGEAAAENVAMGRPWDQGLGKAGATGAATGIGMGGAHASVSSEGHQPAQPGAAIVQPETAPIQQTNSPAASIERAQAATNSVATNDTTEAEKALKTPVELTALDRVNTLDTKAGEVENRLQELSNPENGYGPMFDQERTDLQAQHAELLAQRQELTKDWPKAVEGNAASFTTEAGSRVDAKYALMDAGDLQTSHDENLRKNDAYPQELQPRERDRAASELQVSGIVQKLDPARLGLSADAANGAPIVGADGLVESGNARTIALKRVYQADGAKADDYRQFLRDNAAQFGITPESVDGMAKPVLVRVRTTPVNRAEFARQANASTVAAMSPSEQAKSDANRIDTMEDLVPDDNGDFANTASRPFVRRFMARLPVTEQAGMIDSSGNLSTTGYARVRNAVLARAYGDSPVLSRMVESMDDNLRNVSKALMLAAPKVAQMRAAVQEGSRHAADITPDLMEAVEELSRLKDSGTSVEDALAQAGMFGDKYSPETRQLMQFLADNARRPRRMADFLTAYMDALDAAGDPNQGSLLGENEAPAKQDLINAAERTTDAAKNTERGNPGEDAQPGAATGNQPEAAPRDSGGAQGDGAAGSTPGQRDQQGAGKVGEWVNFPEDSGTLGIPRKDMPQIKGEHRGALVNFLEARGITNEADTVKASSLKPTQAEYSRDKVDKFVDTGAIGERSVLVSSDGHVLDGHHQWLGHKERGENINVIRFSAPIKELLAAVNEFPSVKRSEGGKDSVKVAMVNGKPFDAKRDNYQPPAPSTFLPAELLKKANDYIEKFQQESEEVPISEADRLRATKMLEPALESAKTAFPEFAQRVIDLANAVDALGFQIGPVKTMNRAVEKLASDENKFDLGSMRDILRSTIVVKSYDDAQAVVDQIYKSFDVESGRVKNRTPAKIEAKDLKGETGFIDSGYGDVLVNVLLNGVKAEIQINIPEMLSAKANQGHKLYNIERVQPEGSKIRADIAAAAKELNSAAYAAALSDSRDLAAATTSSGLSAADKKPLSDIRRQRIGQEDVGRISDDGLRSSTENRLPSGNSTYDNSTPSSSVKSIANTQPGGNSSGTFIGTPSEDSLTDKTDNGYPSLLSRSDGGQGMDVDTLTKLAERIKAKMPNMPAVNVYASPADLPAKAKKLRDYIEKQGANDDVEGAMHGGELYMFASGLKDELRAEHVLAEHEAAHFGLRAVLGDSLNLAMRLIYNNNADIRRAANALQRRGKLTNAEAAEEAIVDIPSKELVKLEGWRKVVVHAKNWLEAHGFEAIAKQLGSWLDGSLSDQQRADLFVADLVRAARGYMEGKRAGKFTDTAATMLSGSLAEDAARQEKWLTREAKARGYNDIDELADKNYPLFEQLAALWRQKNPADILLSRNRAADSRLSRAGSSDTEVDDGLVVTPGKGLIKGKFLSSADGDGTPGGPWATEAEALNAAKAWRARKEQRAAEAVATRNRKDNFAEKLRNGHVPTPDEVNSFGLRSYGADLKYFIPTAADLFGITSRQVRPFIADLIRVGKTDMGAIRESVNPMKALAQIANGLNDQKPMLSRAEPAQAATEKVAETPADRADKIIKTSANTVKPLDAVAKAATKYSGIERLTSAIYDRAALLLDKYTPENVKAGMVADYGVPDAVIDQRAMMQGRQRVQLRRVGNLVDKLSTLTREESRVAYEWLNETDPKAIYNLMHNLPEESVKVLMDVQKMIDNLSREAVRMGQLSQEAYERNKFAYLRRSYEKYTLDQTPAEKAGRARAISILGDQYKGRGITDAVAMKDIAEGSTEWWQRKTEAGKADKALKGEKLLRLERRANNGDRTKPLDGMEGKAPGKLLEVKYVPAGEPIPAKFKEWTENGTFEVRDTKGDKAILWRDYTKDERETMGEIDEARFAISKTLHGMVHDVEVGRYLEWLAHKYAKKEGETIPGTVVDASERYLDTFKPGEWVQVPATKIVGTNVAKYGTLAGRYLPGPVWNDLRQTVNGQFKPFGDTYGKILSAWKTAKTALSPAVHTNNIMSNFVMADWHDVTAGHTAKALRILLGAHDRTGKGVLGTAGNKVANAIGSVDREAAQEIVNRYKDSGGDIGSWATNEIATKQIEPLLEAMEKELAESGGNSMQAQVGVMSALQHMRQGEMMKAWDAAKNSKPGKAIGTEAGTLIEMYQNEDEVFRLAAWLKAKEEGKTDMEAGKIARKSFMDYSINAPWVAAMRASAFPFISYSYRAVPMLMEIAAKKPHKLLKLMAVAGALNALGVMLAGGSGGDDDKERKLLPEEKAGRIWGMVPKLIRMPWNDDNGSPVYLDIRRFIPVGDVLDVGANHAAVPLLPMVTPGGPLMTMAELVLNKQGFTGKPITLETDTPVQQAAKVLDYLFKSFAPNILGLPGTYATTSVADAAKGKTDAFGREQSVTQAVISSMGVKLGSYPVDVLRRNERAAAQAKIMEIDKNISALKRQYQTHKIDGKEFQDSVQVENEKKRKIQRELAEKGV